MSSVFVAHTSTYAGFGRTQDYIHGIFSNPHAAWRALDALDYSCDRIVLEFRIDPYGTDDGYVSRVERYQAKESTK